MDTRMVIFDRYVRRAGLEVKTYQREGVAWCCGREIAGGKGGVRGGFVADEMGLGKTITMIGTMLVNRVSTTLIVVPVALLGQWYDQILKTTGHKAFVYHSLHKKKVDGCVAALKSCPIVLTTYGALMTKEVGILHEVVWGRVIFDEAHHLRNKKTLLYSRVAALQAGIRWFVTGTPIQNRKQDFYNLCVLLGLPLAWCKDPVNLRDLVDGYVLKRTKKEVGLAVPDVEVVVEQVAWGHPVEKRLSEDIHSTLPFCNVMGRGGGFVANLLYESGMLVSMLRAKQSCVLPALMKRSFLGKQVQTETETETEEAEQTEAEEADIDIAMRCSSKLDAVVATLLARLNNGRGKLVFCHFVGEMDELAKRLSDVCRVGVLDGRLSQVKRRALLAVKYDVLLLQIQTCCEGLNLQEFYSEIYFVTPHWNPSVEDQAVARCHRMGQKEPVVVFRFAMSGTQFRMNPEILDDFVVPCSLDTYTALVQRKKREEYVV